MGTLRQLKSLISKDNDLRGLMVRSGRSEILLDLDGDKSPDIGLMDVNHDGNIDAIAVDLTGNGEFNFYLADNDGNGIPDEVSFYRDGDDIPVHSEFGRTVEVEMLDSAAKILALMAAEDIAASELLDVLEGLEAFIADEYAKVDAENGDK